MWKLEIWISAPSLLQLWGKGNYQQQCDGETVPWSVLVMFQHIRGGGGRWGERRTDEKESEGAEGEMTKWSVQVKLPAGWCCCSRLVEDSFKPP